MTLCNGIVLLLYLGSCCKVSMAVNSTRVHFFELEIESSVNDAVNNLLSNQFAQINVKDAIFSNVKTTTDCVMGNGTKSCSCVSGNTWSSDACDNYKCRTNEKCTLNVTDDVICLPCPVTINGLTTVAKYEYFDLYDANNQKTEKYNEILKEITKQLQEDFSKLPWFDYLVITAFRRGSVIVEYTVQVLGSVNVTQLESIISGHNGTTKLLTKGLVTISGPQEQPVDISTNHPINCTTQGNLGNVKWTLTDAQNKKTYITNGTESVLTRNGFTDIINLRDISGIWKGLFTCEYTNGTITHTASYTLDIALLPDIRAKKIPQFPDCKSATSVIVEVQCGIINSTENFIVSWANSSHKDLITKGSESRGNMIYYKADAQINCNNIMETISVTCTFTNNRSRNKKYKEKTMEIPIIKIKSESCEKEGNWPITKGSYTAVLDCDVSAVGEMTRMCNGSVWQKEISQCVNQGLHDIYTDLEKMIMGQGDIKTDAETIFKQLKTETTNPSVSTYPNIEKFVDILETANNVSLTQEHQWNNTMMPNFVETTSNILNKTQSWNETQVTPNATSLPVRYLQSVEAIVRNANLLSANHKSKNVQLMFCNSSDCILQSFNSSVNTVQSVTVVAFRNLADILPNQLDKNEVVSETVILSVIPANYTNHTNVEMKFDYGKQRHRNHKMFCVYWDENLTEWSETGCTWGGLSNPTLCNCTHNSAFTIMMSKHPETLKYEEELTYVCLGLSIVSLVLCLLIEFLVWDTVVKSNIANFRHIALVNICVCLLFSYCSFLAPSQQMSENWCLVLTVVKHFCFLCVFFWMLCLSFVLLHQLIFVFEQLQKKVYLTISIVLGYVCPLICVAATFIQFGNGKVDEYYSHETCWLVYKSMLIGSIFAFIFPVGTIVVINMFVLFVVITKIATPAVSESKARDEKDIVRSIIKTIVFLSPILGITWLLGLFVFMLDLVQPEAHIVRYAFTILNSLQGFFILLTNCIGEKKVREALLKRFRAKPSVYSKSDQSTKVTSVVKKN